MSKDKRVKKLHKKLKKEFNVKEELPFDMTDPVTKYVLRPDLQQKRVYISNMNDNFVKAVAGNILELEGIGVNCTNKQLSEWLKKRGLTTESDLYAFCLQYGQEEGDTNE